MTKLLNRRTFIQFNRQERKAILPNYTSHYEQRQQANLAPPSAGLEPYAGPWDYETVRHLLKRTMYGATKSDIEYFLTLTLEEAVNELMSIPPEAAPPVNDYDESDPDIPFGETWVNAEESGDFAGGRTLSLRCWWLGLMKNQTRSVFEKMVFFWHNHVPIEFNELFNGQYSYKYIKTIRDGALGNFKDLTKALTLDSAMLLYLNGTYNEVGAPDENYGRELQELFCIGKGPDSQYTEDDVKASARVLTGWKTTYGIPSTYFASEVHDTEDKQFSAFYGNTVITGKSGDEGALELDEMLTMIFNNNETAAFLCRKIYRYFVYYSIDEATELNVIQPLAQIFRDNNYDILPVLKALFNSAHFFEVANRGVVIKSSLDCVIGLSREMGIEYPDSSNFKDLFQIRSIMTYWLNDMLLPLGDPPNVAGFPAWYQTPTYDKYWISTSTYPKRAEHSDIMLYYGYPSDNFLPSIDLLKFVANLSMPDDAVLMIDEIARLFYSIEIDPSAKEYMKALLLTGQSSDSYWTEIWDAYVNNPDDEMAINSVKTRLQSMFQYILQLEEYQLM